MGSVLTIGTFDLMHFGHVDFLKACASLGEDLTVGVNTDRFAGSFKPEPVMDQDERTYAVEQLGYPAVLNDGPGHVLIDRLRPHVLAAGSDWARKDYLGQIFVTQDWLDGRGITVAYVPRTCWRPMSSTEVRRRVRLQELAIDASTIAP
jgi:cytidyltransferase-like protein